jgi:hypothetical protein
MAHNVKLTYIYISDVALPMKSKSIEDSMTENANFPEPTPAIADIRAAREAYQDALSEAKHGDGRAITVKNQKRDALQTLLRDLSAYVIKEAKNDLAKLTSSGFDLVKVSTGNRTSDKLSIVAGEVSGQISSTMKTVRGARAFVHEFTADPLTNDSVWTQVTVSSRKYLYTGFKPGDRFWFRVRAVLIGGREVNTDPVLRIVL